MSMSEIDKEERFRQYLFFWGGQQVSLLGSSVVQFVIIWFITITTESELMLSLAALVGFGPSLIITPFAGVLADRLNRKAILLLSDSFQAIVTTVLIFVFLTGHANIPIIFIILGFRGAFQAIQSPTMQAIIPAMVPETKLSRINGLTFLSSGVIRIIGPAVAALLLSFVSIGNVLWVDLITFGIAIIPLLMARIPSAQKTTTSLAFFSDMKIGFQTINSTKGMVALLGIFAFVNFISMPLGTLLPLFIYRNHGGTEKSYALIMTMQQTGMVLGSLFMSLYKGFKRKILATIVALMLGYVLYAGLAFIPTGAFLIIGLFLAIMYFRTPIINVSVMTVVQLIVPKDKIGRVMSVIMTIAMVMSPLGMVLSGILGGIIGIELLFIISAIAGFIVSGLIYIGTNAKDLDKAIAAKIKDIEEKKDLDKIAEKKKVNIESVSDNL